jgi:DNA-binding response OmpR family regulator
MKKKILIVEDEIRISRVILLELTHVGYDVKSVEDGKNGLRLARESDWDLILLDVMLPGMSGFEVLRRLRMEDEHTPIILLTARDSVFDKVNGLDHGANDYITKPFEMEELLARIRSAIRISTYNTGNQKRANSVMVIDDLEVNENARTVKRDGIPIELTRREFDLLVFLMNNENQVLTRDQILNEVWGFDYVGETNVVDVYIGYLRKKIDHGHPHALIQTTRGVGFMLKGKER